MIKIVSENVRKLRKNKYHETMEKFAERCDIESKTIYNIESGRVNPSLKTLQKIADNTEVSVAELLT